MKLDDPALDSCAPSIRNTWLADAVREQIAYMRAKVPFWRDRLAKADIDEQRINGLADLAQVPILTKQELRDLSPRELLPDDTLRDLQIGRWTSGTTGRPTVNFWSETDWAALVASTARTLARQAPVRAPIVFNAYSQGHVTGPLYNAALRRLGGVVYDRSHHPEEIFSTRAQTELFEFDTLVLPAQTRSGRSDRCLAPADLADLIGAVARALGDLGREEPEPAKPEPAVPVRRSVQDDHLVCLVCGARHRTLRRHLDTAHQLTPEAYREQFGLKSDYPMAAPGYSRQRSEMAKRVGLGQRAQVPSRRRRPRSGA